MDGNLSRNFFQLGNMMRIDNAIVEDVVCYDNSNGYISAQIQGCLIRLVKIHVPVAYKEVHG